MLTWLIDCCGQAWAEAASAGTFATVNGFARRGIAKIDAQTGAVDPAFNANLNGQVKEAQVVSGRLQFTVEGEVHDAGPGWWLHMSANAPHSLVATQPTVMLLTMLKP